MGVLLTVAAIVISTAAGVGAELRWRDRAALLARRSLTASVFTIVPFVTFFNIARLHIDADVGIGILLGYVTLAVVTGIAWWSGRVMDLPRPTHGALILTALIANTGYLGYPLTVAVLGSEELGHAVAWDLLVSIPALLLVGFGVGAAFGTKAGETPRDRVRSFFTRNPPLYAALAAVVAPDALAPDALVDISRVMVVALLPIGFFAVGAILAEEAEDGYLEPGSPLKPPLSIGIGLRMIVAPALLFAMSAPLIDLPSAYLLLAAMPVGINSLLVGHVYGLDLKLAAQAVAWSTALAVVGALGSLAL